MGKFLAKFADDTGRTREAVFDAPSEADLRSALEARGCFVLELSVQRQTAGEFLRNLIPIERKVSLRELIETVKLLRTMLKAGLPLNESLELLVEETPPGPLANAVEQVCGELREGSSFSKALSRHPKVFPEIFVRTVVAGEKAGALENVLQRLVAYFSTVVAIRRKILGALIYPSILLLVCVAAMIFLMVYVVPTFTSLFASMDTQLPWFTQLVLYISEMAGKTFVPAMLALFLGIYLLGKYAQTSAGRLQTDSWKLRIPLFGDLEELFALSQFSRTLATIIEGGIPLVDGLTVVIDAMENKAISERFAILRTSIERGDTFAKALRAIPNIPTMLPRIVHVGEESGHLGEMLENLADYFDEEIGNLTATLTSFIEPILFLGMALIVGSVIVALFLPILTAASSIR